MASTLLARRTVLSSSRFICHNTGGLSHMARQSSSFRGHLVSPEELNKALEKNAPSSVSADPRTISVCASWFLPNDPQKRNGHATYLERRIPRARFFDLDKIADTSSPYPHMLPSAETFQQAMCGLGIRRDDVVVVYDTAELGIFSAPRVAWTFKVFGHPAVHILNNFKLWVDQGYPTDSGELKRNPTRTEYPLPELDQSKVVGFKEMKGIVRDHNKEGREEVTILDARSAGRWKGTEPEPRPGLPSGHMPGSISIPVPDMLDPDTKIFKSREQLRELFKERGVDPAKPIVLSCGTGVTATVIETALTEAGFAAENRRVYDGSWTEWAQKVQPTENLIVTSK